MNDKPIETALEEAEGVMEIDLLNKVTGVNYPKAAVYGDNTLGQILEEYAEDIGVNPRDSKILFENKPAIAVRRLQGWDFRQGMSWPSVTMQGSLE